MKRWIVFACAVPLLAHHSISGYFYTDQRQKLEGTLVQFEYRSPHAFLHVDVKDPQTGQTSRWAVEWSNVHRLDKQGIKADTLKPGDQLVIIANPSRKQGEHTVHLVGITRPADGWKSGRNLEVTTSASLK